MTDRCTRTTENRNSAMLLRGPNARCGLTVCAMLLLLGCDFPGKPNSAERLEAADQAMSFTHLYRQNCAGCHGADGQLGPAPPLNDPLFLTIIPDAELQRVIHHGRRGTPMPAFAVDAGGTLGDAQITVLVDGLKSHWKTDQTFPDPPPDYLVTTEGNPPAPNGDRQRGSELFAQACAGCHGENGRGGENDGSNAINEPAFLALISNQALRRIIITGRADLGMPNYAGDDGRPDELAPLSSAQIDDLVALLASWRNASGAIATQETTPTRPLDAADAP